MRFDFARYSDVTYVGGIIGVLGDWPHNRPQDAQSHHVY